MKIWVMILSILLFGTLCLSQEGGVDEFEEESVTEQIQAPNGQGEAKVQGLFSFKNLVKLLLSERQDELVDEYLVNFQMTPEEKIVEKLNKVTRGSIVGMILPENSIIFRLYARAHKDDSILKGIAGIFKDRGDFIFFLLANVVIFALNYLRKRHRRKTKGKSSFFTGLMMLGVLTLIQYAIIMYFFGENFRPAIKAYRDLRREERMGDFS